MSEARRIQAQASGDRLHFPGVQAPGDRSHEVPEWPQLFEEGYSGDPKEKTLDDMLVNSESFADLPVFAERSKRPHTSKPTGNHNVCHTFSLKIRHVKSTSSRKLFEFRAGTVHCKRRLQSSSTEIWSCYNGGSQCSEGSEGNPLAALSRSRGTGSLFLSDSKLPSEKQDFARDDETCAKVLAARSDTRCDPYI